MTIGGSADRLNILGAVEFITASGKRKELQGKNAALVCKLALSRHPVPSSVLSELLWDTTDTTSLNTALSAIRKTGMSVDLKNGGYHIRLARTEIDACVFLDKASTATDVAEIDELLALWRQDPRKLGHDLLASTWNETMRVRDKLLRFIAGLPGEVRDQLANLDQFLELFPTDQVVKSICRTWAPSLPRPKLLIVDDLIGKALKDLLVDYECTVVTSLSAWGDLIRDRRRLDIDGALIDYHLTQEGDDKQGLTVLTHLRDFYDIPVLLMSVSPPNGSQVALLREYRLSDIYHKTKVGGLDDISDVVSELLERRKG
ncbi:hypothetical protein [Streptosporangium saharense]|uniref:hypothetical protein n=1 Tax=Streptosporangium saharense TaxID=1706840 RepID=UPI003431A898